MDHYNYVMPYPLYYSESMPLLHWDTGNPGYRKKSTTRAFNRARKARQKATRLSRQHNR